MKMRLPLLALFIAFSAGAQPAYLNYQGRLTDTAGQPLAGAHSLEFSIFDAAMGGNCVWGPFFCDGGTGTGHTARAFLTTDGRFNVILGDLDVTNRSISAAFGGPARFIEIKVDQGPPIQPRQQFLSAPYSLQTQTARTADVAASLVKELADALCPLGTILAFAGPANNIPDGWLWCDGRAVESRDYPRLYAAIGTAWGNGTQDRNGSPENPDNVDTDFNLPDLRGLFMRGATAGGGTAWNSDPDVATRSAIRQGGNTGDAVGSVQTNQVQSHSHVYGSPVFFGSDFQIFETGNLGVVQNSNTGLAGGSETRPKNAYVNYIIKY